MRICDICGNTDEQEQDGIHIGKTEVLVKSYKWNKYIDELASNDSYIAP